MLSMIKGNGLRVIRLFIFKMYITHKNHGGEPDRKKSLMKDL